MTAWERTLSDLRGWWKIVWQVLFILFPGIIGGALLVSWPLFFVGLAQRHEALVLVFVGILLTLVWWLACWTFATYILYKYEQHFYLYEDLYGFLTIIWLIFSVVFSALFVQVGANGIGAGDYKVVEKIELYDHLYECRYYEKIGETFCYLEQEE